VRDDPFEVLMVSRAARGAFASALVFPGGAIDPEDNEPGWREVVEDFDDVAEEERPLRVGAIRELWEETGILLGWPQAPARNGQPLRTALESAAPRIRLDALTRFARWITPAT
jgi:8-oxo-dGTP pyrophosphatase MutT (NUDIX family)